MEQVERAIKEANNAFRTADHLTYVSYPLLRDNRLLLAITQNLFVAGKKGMDAVLYHEKFNKRINMLPLDFDSRMSMFEKDIVPKMKLGGEVCKVIKDLRQITKQHRESPMVFSRKEKFVICSDDYSSMRAIDINFLKNYVVSIRSFLRGVNNLENV